MSAATHEGDTLRGVLEELGERYPGAWACGLFALLPQSKKPRDEAWNADALARYEAWRAADAAERERLRAEWLAFVAAHVASGGNVGLALPLGSVALDVEDAATLRACDSFGGAFQWSRESEQRGHALFRCGAALRQGKVRIDGAPEPVVSRVGGKGFLVAARSVHPETGERYGWLRGLPATPDGLPEFPATWRAQLAPDARDADGGIGSGAIPKGGRNDALHRIAAAMRGRGEPPDAILAELQRVNAERCRPPLADSELRQIARSAARYAEGEPPPASDCEDVSNAERLARHYGEAMRWCTARGWLVWTGTVWEESETRALALASRLGRLVQREAAALSRQASETADESKREALGKRAAALLRWARTSEQAKRIRAAHDLARPALEIADDALDADPWALGCRNGVVDLRTGTLRPHRPADYLTRCTGIDYDPEARSERWERVLAEALPDSPVRAYLARCAGYTACGVTGEDVLLLVHGPTRTSKGTIQGAIAAALGGYTMTAGLETFAARKHADGSRARPELIRLRGARMVSVYETGRALRLDAELVKTLAGSDRITARALYREETEFTPACTLWIATNHRPRVDDDDAALWERMRELPFGVHVPPERRDPKVRASLADASGPDARAVLAWIVRGALAWQREGLGQPDAVKDATKAYRDAMDPLGEYIAECLVLAPLAWVATGALRDDYERWSRERGERPLPATRWGESLRRHGAAPRKVGERRGWAGVGLRVGGSE